ncbi:hypothetical protein ACCD10_12950 [Pseudomonas sp. Pseusp122]|uniref:hypothetical protein n=1 Tax=unclassified Pseudomonas TaxID=196821 RepID=UPI0039A52BB1
MKEPPFGAVFFVLVCTEPDPVGADESHTNNAKYAKRCKKTTFRKIALFADSRSASLKPRSPGFFRLFLGDLKKFSAI